VLSRDIAALGIYGAPRTVEASVEYRF